MKRIKKRGYKKIIIAIFLVIVVFGLYYYFSKDEKDKPATTLSKPYEPPFNKEGELFFISSENIDTIKAIDIEVASDDYKRTQGLMYRRSMADSLGMLFIFEKEEPQSFWMRNTYISLDIIYVNKQYEIVTIQKYTQPFSEFGIPSYKPAMYVVETIAGFCDKYKIKEGDKVYYRLGLTIN